MKRYRKAWIGGPLIACWFAFFVYGLFMEFKFPAWLLVLLFPVVSVFTIYMVPNFFKCPSCGHVHFG